LLPRGDSCQFLIIGPPELAGYSTGSASCSSAALFWSASRRTRRGTERRPFCSSPEIRMIRLVATRLSPLIQGACSSVSRARFTIQQTCSMGEGSISSADENARTPNSADCNRLSSGSRLVRRVTQRNALHGHYCRRRRGGCQLYVGIDLRRWRFWDGYRRPWVQKSELAGNPYQLGTGSAPSLLDLTSKHLLGDLSDVAHDDQQQDLVLQKQIFPADSRVHVAEGGGVVGGCRFSRSLLYTDANLETSSVCAW
jgi:hypothetical protein